MIFEEYISPEDQQDFDIAQAVVTALIALESGDTQGADMVLRGLDPHRVAIAALQLLNGLMKGSGDSAGYLAALQRFADKGVMRFARVEIVGDPDLWLQQVGDQPGPAPSEGEEAHGE